MMGTVMAYDVLDPVHGLVQRSRGPVAEQSGQFHRVGFVAEKKKNDSDNGRIGGGHRRKRNKNPAPPPDPEFDARSNEVLYSRRIVEHFAQTIGERTFRKVRVLQSYGGASGLHHRRVVQLVTEHRYGQHRDAVVHGFLGAMYTAVGDE